MTIIYIIINTYHINNKSITDDDLEGIAGIGKLEQ